MRQRLQKRFVLFILVTGSVIAAAATQSPDVTLRSLEGGDFKLSEKRGQVVVLAFGATWESEADKRLPTLQTLADRYSRHGVEFYWVSLNSSQPDYNDYASDEDLRGFAKRHGLRVPILRDPEAAAFTAFRIENTPALVLIGREGKLHSKHSNFFPTRIGVLEEITRILNRLVK